MSVHPGPTCRCRVPRSGFLQVSADFSPSRGPTCTVVRPRHKLPLESCPLSLSLLVSGGTAVRWARRIRSRAAGTSRSMQCNRPLERSDRHEGWCPKGILPITKWYEGRSRKVLSSWLESVNRKSATQGLQQQGPTGCRGRVAILGRARGCCCCLVDSSGGRWRVRGGVVAVDHNDGLSLIVQ